jgi:actin-related protein
MSIVLELSSYQLRLGKGGDHNPSTIYTSHYGMKQRINSPLKRKRTSEYTFGKCIDFVKSSGDDLLDIRSIYSQNQVRDWSALESLFEQVLFSDVATKYVSPSPVLLVEPLRVDRFEQQKMVEILFEKCGVLALSSVKCTSAGVFANGRTSALALDMGHSFTSVVPVKDGFTDESKLHRTELAGAVMTEASLELLKAEIARSKEKDSNFFNSVFGNLRNPSQIKFGAFDVASRWKEHCCSCHPLPSALQVPSSSMSSSSSISSSFTLPDGSQIKSSGNSGDILSELLFNQSLENLLEATNLTRHAEFPGNLLKNIPRMESVGKILFQSLTQFDADTRRNMWENIVLFGGTSTAAGMSNRVKRELFPLLPGKAEIKIVQSKIADRAISSWIGGSIVATTPDFASLCLAKSKYEEEGVDRALLLQEIFQ